MFTTYVACTWRVSRLFLPPGVGTRSAGRLTGLRGGVGTQGRRSGGTEGGGFIKLGVARWWVVVGRRGLKAGGRGRGRRGEREGVSQMAETGE